MSKYLEVMRERERTCLDHAEWAPEYAAEAADWRRMAEAWEAMVKALQSVTMIFPDDTVPHEVAAAALALTEPKEE